MQRNQIERLKKLYREKSQDKPTIAYQIADLYAEINKKASAETWYLKSLENKIGLSKYIYFLIDTFRYSYAISVLKKHALTLSTETYLYYMSYIAVIANSLEYFYEAIDSLLHYYSLYDLTLSEKKFVEMLSAFKNMAGSAEDQGKFPLVLNFISQLAVIAESGAESTQCQEAIEFLKLYAHCGADEESILASYYLSRSFYPVTGDELRKFRSKADRHLDYLDGMQALYPITPGNPIRLEDAKKKFKLLLSRRASLFLSRNIIALRLAAATLHSAEHEDVHAINEALNLYSHLTDQFVNVFSRNEIADQLIRIINGPIDSLKKKAIDILVSQYMFEMQKNPKSQLLLNKINIIINKQLPYIIQHYNEAMAKAMQNELPDQAKVTFEKLIFFKQNSHEFKIDAKNHADIENTIFYACKTVPGYFYQFSNQLLSDNTGLSYETGHAVICQFANYDSETVEFLTLAHQWYQRFRHEDALKNARKFLDIKDDINSAVKKIKEISHAHEIPTTTRIEILFELYANYINKYPNTQIGSHVYNTIYSTVMDLIGLLHPPMDLSPFIKAPEIIRDTLIEYVEKYAENIFLRNIESFSSNRKSLKSKLKEARLKTIVHLPYFYDLNNIIKNKLGETIYHHGKDRSDVQEAARYGYFPALLDNARYFRDRFHKAINPCQRAGIVSATLLILSSLQNDDDHEKNSAKEFRNFLVGCYIPENKDTKYSKLAKYCFNVIEFAEIERSFIKHPLLFLQQKIISNIPDVNEREKILADITHGAKDAFDLNHKWDEWIQELYLEFPARRFVPEPSAPPPEESKKAPPPVNPHYLFHYAPPEPQVAQPPLPRESKLEPLENEFEPGAPEEDEFQPGAALRT